MSEGKEKVAKPLKEGKALYIAQLGQVTDGTATKVASVGEEGNGVVASTSPLTRDETAAKNATNSEKNRVRYSPRSLLQEEGEKGGRAWVQRKKGGATGDRKREKGKREGLIKMVL